LTLRGFPLTRECDSRSQPARAILIRRALTDGEWRRIERPMPGKKSEKGRHGADNRLFVDAPSTKSNVTAALLRAMRKPSCHSWRRYSWSLNTNKIPFGPSPESDRVNKNMLGSTDHGDDNSRNSRRDRVLAGVHKDPVGSPLIELKDHWRRIV
jgi:hypothetical protein